MQKIKVFSAALGLLLPALAQAWGFNFNEGFNEGINQGFNNGYHPYSGYGPYGQPPRGNAWNWGSANRSSTPWDNRQAPRSGPNDGFNVNRGTSWNSNRSVMSWGNRWSPNFGSNNWGPGNRPNWGFAPGWQNYPPGYNPYAQPYPPGPAPATEPPPAQ